MSGALSERKVRSSYGFFGLEVFRIAPFGYCRNEALHQNTRLFLLVNYRNTYRFSYRTTYED